MTKLLFVINPIAGGIDKEDVYEEIERFCRQQKLDSVFYSTTGDEDEKHIEKLLSEQAPDIVVAVGGDGTVSLVAKLLIGTEIALAIVPHGSGNGLSKDLNIPQDFFEALHVLTNYNEKSIDTLLVNGMVCIHLCDVGFNALVIKEFDSGETRGPGAYAWIALQEFINYEPKEYTVIIDGQIVFQGDAFMVAITNAKAFGSNVTFNPKGVINDGLFEIFILEPFPKTASLGLLYQMYTDAIDESDFSQRFSCQEAIIKNPSAEHLQIDGEPIASAKEIHFKVLPRSLKVILPLEVVQDF